MLYSSFWLFVFLTLAFLFSAAHAGKPTSTGKLQAAQS
jgi:hypothetical protein